MVRKSLIDSASNKAILYFFGGAAILSFLKFNQHIGMHLLFFSSMLLGGFHYFRSRMSLEKSSFRQLNNPLTLKQRVIFYVNDKELISFNPGEYCADQFLPNLQEAMEASSPGKLGAMFKVVRGSKESDLQERLILMDDKEQQLMRKILRGYEYEGLLQKWCLVEDYFTEAENIAAFNFFRPDKFYALPRAKLIAKCMITRQFVIEIILDKLIDYLNLDGHIDQNARVYHKDYLTSLLELSINKVEKNLIKEIKSDVEIDPSLNVWRDEVLGSRQLIGASAIQALPGENINNPGMELKTKGYACNDR